MIIANDASYTNSEYTGVNTFDIPFKFFGLDSIQVFYARETIDPDALPIQLQLVYTEDYTVAGVRSSEHNDLDNVNAFVSGTVTLTEAGINKVAIGDIITVSRSTLPSQETRYTELDNFPAASHENALTKLTMLIQEAQTTLSRALLVPYGATADIENIVSQILALFNQMQDLLAKAESAAERAEYYKPTLVTALDMGNMPAFGAGTGQIAQVTEDGAEWVDLIVVSENAPDPDIGEEGQIYIQII